MSDYGDQTIELADLARLLDVISDSRFENCVFVGPGVIAPVDCRFVEDSFEGDPESIVWEVSEERVGLIGAVGFDNCDFVNCRFKRIGVALPAEQAEDFRSVMQQVDEPHSAGVAGPLPVGS